MRYAIQADERTAFSQRLIEALIHAGYNTGSTAVAREFNIRAGINALSIHGVRKWLKGAALPTQPKLIILAKWLNIEPQWLRYGEGKVFVPNPLPNDPALAHSDLLVLKDFHLLDDAHRDLVHALVENLLEQQKKETPRSGKIQ